MGDVRKLTREEELSRFRAEMEADKRAIDVRSWREFDPLFCSVCGLALVELVYVERYDVISGDAQKRLGRECRVGHAKWTWTSEAGWCGG